ncbi:unnamed protein product [Moneuplotes crassus]|uniref:Uncharacterized protein n=1 Tax=Euplotes crassus TaxID=5936 RepID=A0AAD2D0W7_EUPCR|nr:unnamed protein product [Moneuplotes crassus]
MEQQRVNTLLIYVSLIAIFWTVRCDMCTTQGNDTIESFSYQGYTNTRFTKIIMGDQGNLYAYGKVSGGSSHTLIQKHDSSGTILYEKITSMAPQPGSFYVGKNEVSLYAFLEVFPQGAIVIYNGATGDVSVSVSFSVVPTSDSQIIENDSSDLIYFTTGGSDTKLYRTCPKAPSRDCYAFVDEVKIDGHTGSIAISPHSLSNRLLIVTSQNTQPAAKSLRMMDFAASNFETWATKIDCPSTSCDSSSMSIIPDSSNSQFYVALQFNSNNLFFKISEADGSLVGNIYTVKSGISCSGEISMTQNSNSFYLLSSCSSVYLSVYDSSSGTFTKTYLIAESLIFPIGFSGNSTYNKVYGYWSPSGENGYIGSISVDNKTSHPHLGSTDDIFLQDNSYSITADTNSTSSGAGFNSFLFSPTIISGVSNYDKISANTSSIISEGIEPGTSIDVSLSCSLNQSIGITCATTGLSGASAPSWVTIESSTSLKISESAELPVDATNFTIGCSFGTYNFQTSVSLKSKSSCEVENCETCDQDSSEICDTCKTGYALISKGKGCASDGVQNTVIASQAVMGIGVLSSFSSPQGAWSMVNQFQVLMLMPLTRSYFPSDIILFLTGMKFTLLSLSFIPFPEIPGIKTFVNQFDFDQMDDYIYEMEIKSGSTFVNSLTLLSLVGLIAIFHFFISLLKKTKETDEEKKLSRKVIWWLYEQLTFGVYIRIILEAFLLVVVSSLYELYMFTYDNLLSYIANIVIIFLWGSFFIICLWQWVRSKDENRLSKARHFREFYAGIKPNWRSRVFTAFFLSKRFILISLVVLLERLTMISKVIIFVIIQLLCCGFICFLRPFSELKNNIIEVINEIYFLFCSSVMLFLNKSDDWEDWHTSLYINILLSNIVMISLISLIFLIKDLAVALIKCKQGSIRKIQVKKSQKFEVRPTNFDKRQMSLASKARIFEESKVGEKYDMNQRYKEAIELQRQEFMSKSKATGHKESQQLEGI